MVKVSQIMSTPLKTIKNLNFNVYNMYVCVIVLFCTCVKYLCSYVYIYLCVHLHVVISDDKIDYDIPKLPPPTGEHTV